MQNLVSPSIFTMTVGELHGLLDGSMVFSSSNMRSTTVLMTSGIFGFCGR